MLSPRCARFARGCGDRPLGGGRRWGEAEQRVAIVFILLATQGNFSRQSLADGVRQRVEAIEDLHNAALLGERGEGDDYFCKVFGRNIYYFCPLG